MIFAFRGQEICACLNCKIVVDLQKLVHIQKELVIKFSDLTLTSTNHVNKQRITGEDCSFLTKISQQ